MPRKSTKAAPSQSKKAAPSAVEPRARKAPTKSKAPAPAKGNSDAERPAKTRRSARVQQKQREVEASAFPTPEYVSADSTPEAEAESVPDGPQGASKPSNALPEVITIHDGPDGPGKMMRTLLPPEFEQDLADWVIERSTSHVPLSKMDIRREAKRWWMDYFTVDEDEAPAFSAPWMKGFCKRNPETDGCWRKTGGSLVWYMPAGTKPVVLHDGRVMPVPVGEGSKKRKR